MVTLSRTKSVEDNDDVVSTSGKKSASLVFIFNGQGSPWEKMGLDLIESSIVFRTTMKRLQSTTGVPLVDLYEDGSKWLSKEYSSIGIVSFQLGLIAIIRSFGVRMPDYFLGSSVGELLCAFLSGHLTEEEVMKCAMVWSSLSTIIDPKMRLDIFEDEPTTGFDFVIDVERPSSKLFVKKVHCDSPKNPSAVESFFVNGEMASVSCSAENLESMIARLKLNETRIGCYNSARNQVVCGPYHEMRKLEEYILQQEDEILFKTIDTDSISYHAMYMKVFKAHLKSEFGSMLSKEGVCFKDSPIPSKWISTSQGSKFGLDYLVENMLSPVHLQKAVECLPEGSTVVEVGPSILLLSQIKHAREDLLCFGLVDKESNNDIEINLKAIKQYWPAVSSNVSEQVTQKIQAEGSAEAANAQGTTGDELQVLSDLERQKILYDWNATESPFQHEKTLHTLFEEQAVNYPDNIALTFEGKSITYDALNKKANQVARAVTKAYQESTGSSIKPDTLIVLLAGHGIEVIYGMLGIMKAGAAYVPVDPKNPKERIEFIISDSNASIVVTLSNLNVVKELVQENSDSLRNPIFLDQSEYFSIFDTSNLPCKSGPQNLAYVIYTSGTTGKPKGVLANHISVNNIVKNMIDMWSLDSTRKVIQIASVGFDASVMDIYTILLSGGNLFTPSDNVKQSSEHLCDFMIENEIDTFPLFIPSMLAVFPKKLMPAFKTLCVGAEKCPQSLMEHWCQGRTLMNVYGPTEACVISNMHRFSVGDSNVNIGKALGNVSVYILDNTLNPVPVGAEGEIHVGGVGVARGYLNRPELTSDKFIANPFVSEKEKIEGKNMRLYKTGDLGKWDTDGSVLFVGRNDFQVKLRGFRIELGEIEKVLIRNPGIKHATVLLQEDDALKHLVAYYLLEDGIDSSSVTAESIRKSIINELPEYMIPSFFIHLDDLPLTVNGKLDRRALPKPDIAKLISKDYVSPNSSTECTLCEVWQEVLGLRQVGITDNFFHIGGDSIKAILVVSQAKEKGLYLQVSSINRSPTIEQLAKNDNILLTAHVDQSPAQGTCSLLPIQHWFFRKKFSRPHHWCQAEMVEMQDQLDMDKLENALNKLVHHHDSLRLRFRAGKDDEVEQYFDDSSSSLYNLSVLDLSDTPIESREEEISNWSEKLHHSLNYEKGPLLGAGVIQDTCGTDYLLLTIHHLVMDGVSWRVLLPDLNSLYYSKSLPPKTHSYKDWSEALISYAQGDAMASLQYWENVEQKSSLFAMNQSMDENQLRYGDKFKEVDLVIPEKLTDQLLHHVGHAYNTQINEILLTAFALSLKSVSAHQEEDECTVSFQLEGHGREDIDENIDFSRTVGWFTSVFPVAITLNNTGDLDKLIPDVKEQIRAIPDKGLSYGVLAYMHPDVSVRNRLDPSIMNKISFNYLGQFDQIEGNKQDGMAWQRSSGPKTRSNEEQDENCDHDYLDVINEDDRNYNLLDVNGAVRNNKLIFNFTFRPEYFDTETMERLGYKFEEYLSALVSHCVEKQETYNTPSDYPLLSLSQSSLDAVLREANSFGKVEDLYPATALQSGFIFHSLNSPDSDSYFVQFQWFYEGCLDVTVMKKAWKYVINRHHVLRTGFSWSHSQDMLQVVYDSVPFVWEEFDVSSLSNGDQQKYVLEVQENDRKEAFNLDEPPLYRFKLVKLEENKSAFIFSIHHILLDGWSATIINNEVSHAYENLMKGQSIPHQPNTLYKDFVAWYQQQDKEAALNYWRTQVSVIEHPSKIDLSTYEMKKDDSLVVNNFDTVKYLFTREETVAFNSFVQDHQVTLNIVFQLAWGRLINIFSGDEHSIHGTVLSGRNHDIQDIDKMVGLFINTLPVVVDWQKDESIIDKMKYLHKQFNDINEYSSISLADVQQLVPSAEESLFQTIAVYENYPVAEDTDKSLKKYDYKEIEKTHYSLTALSSIDEDQLRLSILYDTSLFGTQAMNKIITQLSNIMKSFMKNAHASHKDIQILTENDYNDIVLKWNDTESPYQHEKTLHTLFEEQAIRTPDHIAITYQDKIISYQELNDRANQVARAVTKVYEKSTGTSIQPSTLVFLLAERSIEVVCGMLGIMKAGAAYVPVDPTNPKERIEFILSDIKASVVVTQSHLAVVKEFVQENSDILRNPIFLDQSEYFSSFEKSNLPSKSGPQDLAYVIYTSGTTGKPKGALLNHVSVNNFTSNMINMWKLSPKNQLLQIASVGFDATVMEIYPTLLSGGTLFIPMDHIRKSPDCLCEYMIENEIDTAPVIIPSVLALFPMIPMPSLKVLNVGAESCSQAMMEYWSQGRTLLNAYGPTEAAVASTMHHFSAGDSNVNIGKALGNVCVYILDKYLNPVPVGVSGEIHVGGVGVGRGYLNRPDLTSEKFIANPFTSEKEMSQGKNMRLYKTGDLGKWETDGSVSFLGRNDFQVKLRGFRVELGEIEKVLGHYTGIKHAFVLLHKEDDKDVGLVAYYLLEENIDPSTFTVDSIRSFMEESLPYYMVPSFFVYLEVLPLTVNGKLDRKKLPKVDTSGNSTKGSGNSSQRKSIPSNDIEQMILNTWSDVLGLDNIELHDNFFHVGGHSLLATQAASRIQRHLSKACTVKDIFDYPTVKALASHLIGYRPETVAYIPQLSLSKGSLSSAQKRLWFIDQYQSNDSSNYHMPFAYKFSGSLQVEKLELAINQVLERHQGLRSVFQHDKFGNPHQVVLPIDDSKISLSAEEITHSDWDEQSKSMISTPFNLESDMLFRAKLFAIRTDSGDEKGNIEYRLLVVKHHIVSDGWSMGIFVRELELLYNNALKGETSQLPPLSIQYMDFAAWESDYLASDALQQSLEYWKNNLSGFEDLELPLDKPRPATQTNNSSYVEFDFGPDLTDGLKELCKETGSTLFMVVLGGISLVLSRYSGQEDIVIGTPFAGRWHPQAEDLIGLFVNTIVMRVQTGNKIISDFLNEVKTATLNAYEHQAVPFDYLVDQMNIERDQSRSPIFQVMYSWEDSSHISLPNFAGVDADFFPLSYELSKFDLDFGISDGENGIVGTIEYNKDLFYAETIHRMVNHLKHTLSEMVKQPQCKTTALSMLTPHESKQIIDAWNATEASFPDKETLHGLFEKQVLESPDESALVFENKSVSYNDLNKRANQVARAVRETYEKSTGKAFSAGTFVILLLERGVDALVGMLGVLKSGGAYIPVDPSYPEERINFIISDTDAKTLLTHSYLPFVKNCFQSRKNIPEVIFMDDKDSFMQYETCNLASISGSGDLAYSIYTSGTTGKPKGVLIYHMSANNLACNKTQFWNLGAGDRVLQYVSVGFDVFVSETYATLHSGASLYIVDEAAKLSPSQLMKYIRDNMVNVADIPPAMLAQIPLTDLPNLKVLTVGGESCEQHLMDQWCQGRKLLNAYGPTETTVDCTTHIFSKGDLNLNIGKPIGNVCVYVLDNSLNPVPVGVNGELYVGGVGVAKGYLNRDELTAERFISNPFVSDEEKKKGKNMRLYKTGDLVKWQVDGDLIFLGRNDFQVKLRGYRIELGEIESILGSHTDIKNPTVLLHGEGEQKKLVAYYVIDSSEDASMFTVEKLRLFMEDRLPNYMVPSFFVPLEKIPLTVNGKVDRKALPKLDAGSQSTEVYVGPTNNVESILCEVWQRVLGLGRVGITDNFFHIGGDSIKVVMVVEQARERGISFPVSSVFSSPTIMKLVRDQGLNEVSSESVNKDGSSSARADDCLSSDEKVFKQIREETSTLTSRLSEMYKSSNLSKDSLKNFSLQAILLTGSTGFLGGHILHELLTSNMTYKIFCLVRSKNTTEAFNKVSDSFSTFGLLSNDVSTAMKERCEFVCGDLSKENFGLDKPLYDNLKKVSCIIHAAASINHMNSYDSMKHTNVHGTFEVLRLSFSGETLTPVFHMSTVSVFASGKTPIMENDNCVDELEHMEVGYTQTKWAAEQLCSNAQKEGLPVGIFRVGNIAASLRTDGTLVNAVWQRNTYLSSQYAAYMKMGMVVFDEDDSDGFTLDIVPVNFAASCVVHALHAVGTPHIDLWSNFHLSDVHPGVKVDTIVESLKATGKEVEKVSFSTFLGKLTEEIENCPDADDRHAYKLLKSLLDWYGQMKSGEGVQSYDCGRLMSLLGNSDIKCPDFGTLEVATLMKNARPFVKGASIN